MTAFPLGATIRRTDLETNPHPYLHRLRATEPVSWLPVLNGWLITRYDLAIQVMRDAATFTVDHPDFSTAQVVGPSMLSLDGAAHQQHRAPFERPFRRRAVEERFTSSTNAHSVRLLDGLVATGRAELRRAYAGPLAVQTMVDALGLSTTPVTAVLGWYDQIVEAVERVTLGEAVSATGQAAFSSLREHLLPVLRCSPASNLLAAAHALAHGLSDDQIVANAAVLLFGGIETTEGMIANTLYYLLTDPQILADVQKEPALLPAVIEETLRLEPAASVVDRYATTNVALAGAPIQAGDLVRVSLSGANRDPAIFANPDHFDPSRANLATHVAFAQGPHVCLGLHLARLEAQQAVTHLLERLPDLQLVADQVAAAAPRGLLFRKPAALHVEWRVAR